ncbi:MAG: hypothetical protein HKM07_02485 [Chlamydiae bacterium]|nr:hypothetical protein [Chlamydiota bacterium]
MDKLKTIFLVFTFLCFVNIAAAEDSSRPILKIIPAPKNLKDENVCDYLLVVENFSKGELFLITSEKFFFRDFGQFTQGTLLEDPPLFFAIRAEDYPQSDRILLRCVDISKNSGTLIYFTPNPSVEDFSDNDDDDTKIESNLKTIENYLIQLGNKKIYTLVDLTEFQKERNEVILSDNSPSKINPLPILPKHSFPSISNIGIHSDLKNENVKKGDS